MKNGVINSNDFDLFFKKILMKKEGHNIVNSRFDLEKLEFKFKADFIINLISSLNDIKGITCKILFWEDDLKVEKFINLYHQNKAYTKTKSYKNGKKPGIVFIDDISINESFLKLLLNSHFNFELAKEPSQNIRIQICVNLEKYIMLFDIYDDRGFFLYYINFNK